MSETRRAATAPQEKGRDNDEIGRGGFVTADKLPISAAPSVVDNRPQGGTPNRLDVIRAQFRSGADQLSDDEIAFVLSEADRTKLDPLRQLACWRDPRTGKIVIHVRIDGLLALAERTGLYRGAAPTVLTWRVDGKTIEAPIRHGPPAGERVELIAATVAVYRKDFEVPVEVTRWWADYAPRDIKPGSSWDRMGSVMLEKCALAGAPRRAFPYDLAGLYEPSEMGET